MQQPKGVSMGMLDIGASILDFGLNAWQEENKMDWQEQQAQVSRDWQERMANTQYQRTVQDLNAAGLSPMLAYSKGATSLPSGATATGGGAAVSNIAGGVQRSEDRELAAEQRRVAEAQYEVNIQSARKVAADAAKTALEIEQMPTRFYYDLAEIGSRINNNTAASANNIANAASTNQGIKIRKPEEEASDSWWKKNVSPYLGDAGKVASTVATGAAAARSRLGLFLPGTDILLQGTDKRGNPYTMKGTKK